MAWVKTGMGDQFRVWLCWSWLYAPQCLCSLNAMCTPLLGCLQHSKRVKLKFPEQLLQSLPFGFTGEACSERGGCGYLWISGTFSPYRAVEAPGPGGEEAVRPGILTGFPVHACLYPKAGGAASHKRCGSRQGERRADKTGECHFLNINKDP